MNLDISDVLVELGAKPKCSIVCPFEKCVKVSQLSLIPQVDAQAPPKFNPSNFERHIQTQHIRKRKPLTDLSNNRNELQANLNKSGSPISAESGPSCSKMFRTDAKNSIQRSNENCMDLVSISSTPRKVNDSLSNTELEDEMMSQHAIIKQLEKENITLRHKVMDTRGTIRVFCRIKPAIELECFKFERSQDGTLLKLCKY